MDYLRFLLLGNTLRGQYLESEHLLRSVLEKRRVCLFTSSRSASSPAVSNSMTQTQTQTPNWLRRAGDDGKSASFSPRT